VAAIYGPGQRDLADAPGRQQSGSAGGPVGPAGIARHLGSNRNAVYKLTHDARKRLKRGLEAAIAVLIALRPVSARASALGSALAAGMFATTLSFLLTTPGVWVPLLGGFPALSAVPGQFLLKDVVLLGAALWSLGESLARRRG
jgi:Protein of unknown function, DUF417